MHIDTSFLRSRLAVRIFLLYVITALVPVTALILLAHFHFSEQYRQNLEQGLRESTKSYGIGLYDRLRHADEVLRSISASGKDSTALIRLAQDLLPADYLGLAIIPNDDRPPVYMAGSEARFKGLTRLPEQPDPSLADASRVVLLQAANRSVHIALARDLHTGPHAGAELLAWRAPDYLWGWSDEFDLRSSICVLGPGSLRLFCSDQRLQQFLPRQSTDTAAMGKDMPIETRMPGLIVQSWDLFIGSAFRGHQWHILQAMPEADLLEELSGFKDIFLRFLLLTLLLVAFLSVHQIRRSFTPLAALMDGIRRIGKGEFNSRLAIESRDEFGALGQAFNHMAERIHNQLQRLTALSQIDRSILARKPTTDIIADVLHEAPSIRGVKFAALALADRSMPNTFVVYFARNEPADAGSLLQQVHTLSPDEKTLLKAGELYRPGIADKSFQRLFSHHSVSGQTRLLLSPVHLEERLAAILSVGYDALTPLEPEDSTSVEELANRVAVALSNAAWEDKLQHMAYHDPLTGLPNRLLLRDRLEQALAWARRSQGSIAVIFIDLDRFKTVNDSLGHSSGDALLCHLARALATGLRGEDTLARLGGDEFVALISDLNRDRNSGNGAAVIARKLQAAATTPFFVEDREIRPTASLGIALFPDDGTDAESLLKNADAAMYQAKSLGRGTYQFYSGELNEQSLHRLDLEADLHRALENEEFVLYFQPKIATNSRLTAGIEALVRWAHPEKGIVMPGAFIEVAEETGMIIELGQWVLNQACRQAVELARMGFGDLSMAVNVSPRQFREAGLIEQVRGALSVSGLPPEKLELEITEGSAVENIDRALNVLEGFQELGAKIGIDDFGVGYASLSYMKLFPANTLKIDRSFVSSLETDAKDKAIVAATISLAHSLGLNIVAEGVENEVQFRFLQSHDCDMIQGYLFSRPLPFADLVKLLQRERQQGAASSGNEAAR